MDGPKGITLLNKSEKEKYHIGFHLYVEFKKTKTNEQIKQNRSRLIQREQMVARGEEDESMAK